MAIDPKILTELKSALLKEKAELEADLGRIAKPVDAERGDYKTSFEDIGRDREDNTTEVEQYTDNMPVEMTLEKRLRDVINALEKIEKGTYGICANCNQEIEIERLRANPSARRCVKCKGQSVK